MDAMSSERKQSSRPRSRAAKPAAAPGKGVERPRARRAANAPAAPAPLRFFDRPMVDGAAMNATPSSVKRRIAGLVDLCDGRTVAAIVAESPLPPALTWRILDRLRADGALVDAPPARRPSQPSAPPPAASPRPPSSAWPEADTLRMPFVSAIEPDTLRMPFLPAVEPDTLRMTFVPPIERPAVSGTAEPLPTAAPAESAPARVASASIAAVIAALEAAEPPVPAVLPQPPAETALPPPAALPAAAFSDMEENFFASEAPEIREARELAEAGPLTSLSGQFRRPSKRALTIGGWLAALLAWIVR